MAEGVCSAEIRHKLAAVFKDDRVSRSRHVYLSGALVSATAVTPSVGICSVHIGVPHTTMTADHTLAR